MFLFGFFYFALGRSILLFVINEFDAIHSPWKSTMNYYHRFLKLFGKCLPGRKGKGNEDAAIDRHGEDQKITTQVDGDSKKDVVEAPKVFEKENAEANPATEEPAQDTSEDRNAETETEIESEEGEIDERKESVSLPEETSKTDEGPLNEIEESKDGNAVKTTDPQDEDYNWEVSCCGVDMPLAK
jgi:hypothetical protein